MILVGDSPTLPRSTSLLGIYYDFHIITHKKGGFDYQ